MSIQPSPFQRLASATVTGLVSIAAQTFAGVKTFTSAIVASAGVQLGALWNTNGTGATDVCVRVGTSTADGSVNASAVLARVADGIGGTEVSSFDFLKGGILVGPSSGGGATLRLNGSVGAQLDFNAGSLAFQCTSVAANMIGAGQVVWQVTTSYAVNVKGTDSTGTPGAATINRAAGKSAIAAASSSVIITNSLVTASSHIIITPHARDATCKELIAVPAAGSFTVSGTANATAALPFSWEAKGLL